MALQGAAALRARLKALKVAFKPIGKTWADRTAVLARSSAPRKTGKGAASIRVKNASQRKATVTAAFYMHIQDSGAKAHDIVPRRADTLVFPVAGRTIFSKKVHKPRMAGSGFATRAAKQALRENPMAETLIKEWNAAA